MRLAILILGLALVSCGSTSSPTLPSPTTTIQTQPQAPTRAPATPQISDHFSGTISQASPRCSSPGSIHDGKPCLRHTFTTNGSGPIRVQAVWSWLSGSSPTDLDLELWLDSRRIAETTDIDTNDDTISTEVIDGIDSFLPGRFEVRVIYYSGDRSQEYAANALHPQ